MRAILLFVLLCSMNGIYAQLEPVRWSFEAEKVSEGEYDIIFTARMDKGWSVYSPQLKGEGPVPTTFEFYDDIRAIGQPREAGNRKEIFDENFGMQIIKFSGRAKFTQRVKVDGSDKVKGHLTFMTCDEEGCLPPADVNFEIALK